MAPYVFLCLLTHHYIPPHTHTCTRWPRSLLWSSTVWRNVQQKGWRGGTLQLLSISMETGWRAAHPAQCTVRDWGWIQSSLGKPNHTTHQAVDSIINCNSFFTEEIKNTHTHTWMRGFLMLKVVNKLQLPYWTWDKRFSLPRLINADCMIVMHTNAVLSLLHIDFPAGTSQLPFYPLYFCTVTDSWHGKWTSFSSQIQRADDALI